MKSTAEKIAVIGLGYVGLPVAVSLARAFANVVGFDVSKRRVTTLNQAEDWTGEISSEVLKSSSLKITDRPADLANCNFFIVTVPTPIDSQRRPDLSPLEGAV
jgi:UDP-N-acetyl-D-glucosamine/UDP-N-acetyl-D-galactosamine dehydrogenase